MNDTKRLAKIVGYDGGDSEDVLLNALKQAVDIEIADNWDRIRKKDMYIGSIVGTIIARGYIKKSRLGFAGYMVTFVGKAERPAANASRAGGSAEILTPCASG